MFERCGRRMSAVQVIKQDGLQLFDVARYAQKGVCVCLNITRTLKDEAY